MRGVLRKGTSQGNGMKIAGDELVAVGKISETETGSPFCGPKSFRSVIVHAWRALVISEFGNPLGDAISLQ